MPKESNKIITGKIKIDNNTNPLIMNNLIELKSRKMIHFIFGVFLNRFYPNVTYYSDSTQIKKFRWTSNYLL